MSSKTQIIIDIAKKEDIRHLCELEEVCFTTDRLSASHFKHLIQKPSALIMIAKEEAHPIASSVVLFRKNSAITRLYSLAVHPDFQRRGIAKMLNHALENAARNRHCSEIRLEVREDNEYAIQLYLKNGYQLFGHYNQFYQDGTRAIRMRKPLTDETS